MKTQSVKAVCSVVSAAALIAGGAAAVAPAIIDAPALAQENAVLADEATAAASKVNVEGSFSFSQDAVTSTSDISSVFAKAAATLCQSMPEYGAACLCDELIVNSPAGALSATVSELADEEGAQSYVMGCACASNIAGGGAIANAEVSGVSIEALTALAGI